jgi:hypothetical protein
MAIDANGKLVTPNTIAGLPNNTLLDGTGWLAQPPHIGIVSNFQQGNPNVDVLWDNCIFDLAVPIASLLEILQPFDDNITQFSGKIVRRTTNNQSSEYIGAVVLLAGIFLPFQVEAVDFVVVKSVGPGQFFWASRVSDIEVVPTR